MRWPESVLLHLRRQHLSPATVAINHAIVKPSGSAKLSESFGATCLTVPDSSTSFPGAILMRLLVLTCLSSCCRKWLHSH